MPLTRQECHTAVRRPHTLGNFARRVGALTSVTGRSRSDTAIVPVPLVPWLVLCPFTLWLFCLRPPTPATTSSFSAFTATSALFCTRSTHVKSTLFIFIIPFFLFHSAQRPPGPPTWSQMAGFRSFSWPPNIPLRL